MALSYSTFRFQVKNDPMHTYFACDPIQALNLANENATFMILGKEWNPIDKDILEAEWSVKRLKEDSCGNAKYAIIAKGFLCPVNNITYETEEDAENELKALLRK